MRKRWGRTSAIAGLLAALFSDLRRRAWWAYRGGHRHAHAPPTTIVARRPAEAAIYIPTITEDWRSVAASALPVRAIREAPRGEDDPLPVVWIDLSDRPDIADLPRVLERETRVPSVDTTMAAQWLADPRLPRIVLVITYLEPVVCTWALSFELPRWRAALGAIAEAGELFMTWDPASGDEASKAIMAGAKPGVLLSRIGPSQLRPLLAQWDAERGFTPSPTSPR